MSVEEIKNAIYELSPDERSQLFKTLLPKPTRASETDSKRIQSIIEKNNEEETWVSWDDLKIETGH